VIPKIAGQPIPDIFAAEGEAAFREYEFQALQSILKENAIIATGGGVVTYEKSYALLKELTDMPVFS
jgi:Shikimate kinase